MDYSSYIGSNFNIKRTLEGEKCAYETKGYAAQVIADLSLAIHWAGGYSTSPRYLSSQSNVSRYIGAIGRI